MLAQRTGETVIVDAVELDVKRRHNRREKTPRDSPWAGRLQIHQADIQQWQPRQTRRYELIVSNPPFSQKAYLAPPRSASRLDTPLDHATLLTCAAELITEEGFSALCFRSTSVTRVLCSGRRIWAGICVYERMSRKRNAPAASGSAGFFAVGGKSALATD